MCLAPFWDFLVLDLSFLLALTGGAMVLRAKAASPASWLLFGVLSASVGAFLFVGTASAQDALQVGAAGLASTACG